MLHVFRVALGALGAPHEPQLEDIVVAAALDHFVARVEADVVVFILLEQIVGAHLIAAHEQVLFTHIWVSYLYLPQGHIEEEEEHTYLFAEVNRRTLEDAAHELVRIPGDRVGALDAGQLVAQLRRQQAAAAPGRVNVEPHVVLGADVGDRVHRIEGAQNGRAAGAVHVEGPIARLDALPHEALEFVHAHSAALIAGNLNHVVRAEATSSARALARVVALYRMVEPRLVWAVVSKIRLINESGCTHVLRGEENGLLFEAAQTLALVFGEHLVSGDNDRVEI